MATPKLNSDIYARFDAIEKRFDEIENHYKVRLKNQENMDANIKTIMDALIETPLNDGGVIQNVKRNTQKINDHSEVLAKHKDFFIIIGSGIVLIITIFATIINSLSK